MPGLGKFLRNESLRYPDRGCPTVARDLRLGHGQRGSLRLLYGREEFRFDAMATGCVGLRGDGDPCDSKKLHTPHEGALGQSAISSKRNCGTHQRHGRELGQGLCSKPREETRVAVAHRIGCVAGEKVLFR